VHEAHYLEVPACLRHGVWVEIQPLGQLTYSRKPIPRSQSPGHDPELHPILDLYVSCNATSKDTGSHTGDGGGGCGQPLDVG